MSHIYLISTFFDDTYQESMSYIAYGIDMTKDIFLYSLHLSHAHTIGFNQPYKLHISLSTQTFMNPHFFNSSCILQFFPHQPLPNVFMTKLLSMHFSFTFSKHLMCK